jgi:hypothetical protein
LPKKPLLGPLRVLDLADQPGLHPAGSFLLGKWTGARSIRAADLLQLGSHPGKLGLAEPTSSPSGIGKRTVEVESQVKGAESAPAPLGCGEPNHHKILSPAGPDLQPAGRPTCAVGRIGSLGDDAFEPQFLNLLVEHLALCLKVIQKPDHPRGGHHFSQQRLTGGQRQRPEIEVLEREQVKREEGYRAMHRRMADVERSTKLRSLLEPLKAGTSRFVQGNDLAIEQQPVKRERTKGAHYLGKAGGQIVAVSGEQAGGTVSGAQNPVTVDLELEHPSGPGKGLFSRLG